ncbi:MAG: HlyD family type I secretion periplasmic adaptor subunit [Burkholderiales bacterium]
MSNVIELRPAVVAARTSSQNAKRLVRAGWLITLGAVVPICTWMALAPLNIAVVAPSYVKVDLNRRPVQHREGGIVRDVLVRDGQRVKAGDPVLVLADVSVDADRNRLRHRVNMERASIIRLEAEQVLAKTLVFPPDLIAAAKHDRRIKDAMMKETLLFDARREAIATDIELLKAQREQIHKEIQAMHAQIKQAQSSLALQNKDLEANQGLLKGGFISQIRVGQIEVAVTDYAGKLEERRSELARAEQRLIDTERKIKSIQHEYIQTASDQLKNTMARFGEIEQETRKMDDASVRQIVRAPVSGEIIDLKFASRGSVVRPGDTIAEIVPADTNLFLESRIRPEEIGYVALDQPARIKFTAFKYRNTSMVSGKVTYVSGDRLIDKAGNPYYSVLVIADADSLKSLVDFKVQAGMPAEVYLDGTPQTPFQFLTEPVMSTVRKAGRMM